MSHVARLPLAGALLAVLLVPAPSFPQSPTEDHPGFWVDWIRFCDSTATDAVLGDADRDGDPDLILVDGDAIRLWRNDGAGTFAPDPGTVGAGAFTSVVVFDLDGDPHPDLVGARVGGGLSAFRGLGGGQFADAVQSPGDGETYRDLVVADVSGDAAPELVGLVAEPGTGFAVLDHQGLGVFGPARTHLAGHALAALAVTDLDHDQRNDLVVSVSEGDRSLSNALEMVSNGAGGFEVIATAPHAPSPTAHVEPVDLDGDGDPDLVSGAGDGIGLWFNDGTGRGWSAAGTPLSSGPTARIGIHALDLDLDGRPELCVAWRLGLEGGLVSTYQCVDDPFLSNPVHTSYSHVTELGRRAAPPNQLLSGDLDGDARPDLVLLSLAGPEDRSGLAPSDGMVGVVLGRDDGTLGGITYHPPGARIDPEPPPGLTGTVAATGDLNHDGREDLVLRQDDGRLEIAWNDPLRRFRRVVPVGLVAPVRTATLVGDVDGDGWNELVLLRMHRPRDGAPADTIASYRVRTNGKVRLVHERTLPLVLDSGEYIPFSFFGAVLSPLDDESGDEILLLVGWPGDNRSRLRVLRATGDGGYRLDGTTVSVRGENPRGPVTADLDHDGDLDVTCTTSVDANLGLLHVRWNDGAGNLTGVWARRLAGRPGAPRILDFDADGVADVVVPGEWGFRGPPPGWPGSTYLAVLHGRLEADTPFRRAAVPLAAATSERSGAGFGIRQVTPNPAREGFTVRWAAAPDRPASLDLHDLAGRRVRSLELGASPVREREAWFESLPALPAGLYWVRLRQGGRVAARRVALIR